MICLLSRGEFQPKLIILLAFSSMVSLQKQHTAGLLAIYLPYKNKSLVHFNSQHLRTWSWQHLEQHNSPWCCLVPAAGPQPCSAPARLFCSHCKLQAAVRDKEMWWLVILKEQFIEAFKIYFLICCIKYLFRVWVLWKNKDHWHSLLTIHNLTVLYNLSIWITCS